MEKHEVETLFRRDYKDYTRDFDYLKQYVMQCVTYASIQNPNIDKESYANFVRQQISKEGKFPYFNPKMRVITKDENNDRYLTQTTMMDYLKQVVGQDLRFAPTFTTYMPEYRLKSVEAASLDVGMDARNKEKKNKFIAKEAGNDELAEYHDNMQRKLKVMNNSYSGAKATAGTILYNATGHSTLTSVCRSETSFANSINEKFLGGYRHYFDVQVIINNIIAVLTFADIELCTKVIEDYQLHLVTPDELLEDIKRSSDLYWRSKDMFLKLESFVRKLTPMQCSIYLYNGDLFCLRKYNEPLIRSWFDTLLNYKDLSPLQSDDETNHWLSLMDGDIAAMVAIYLDHLCNGKSLKTIIDKHPEHRSYIAAVVKNVLETFAYYSNLIKAFWVSDIMPFETAKVPDMMRGVVLGSDTDSSLFTVALTWVKWYCGDIKHTKEANDIEATVVYLTTQHVAHTLGMMTGILNVAVEKRHYIAMKNEFAFSSFTTTSLGKHYFAKKDAQEGIIINKNKMETEIKGVGLKHTKVPINITKGFEDTLNDVMNKIEADEKISIVDYLNNLAQLELSIFQSITNKEPTYFKRGQIKVREAYKDQEKNNYVKGYLFWEETFAPKYGHTVHPPYDVISIPISTDTASRFNTWLDHMEDTTLANRIRTWINENNGGRPMKTIHMPQAVAASVGIPNEIIDVIQPRKIVYSIVAPYYILLESFGVFYRNKKITRLASDMVGGEPIPESLNSYIVNNSDYDDSDD